MNKNIKTAALLAVSLIFLLCGGCSTKEATGELYNVKTLAERQTEILKCGTDYMECLKRTRSIKGDFAKFDDATNECVKKANNCPAT